MAYEDRMFTMLTPWFPCYALNTSELPSFYLLVGRYWVEVRPEDYVNRWG